MCFDAFLMTQAERKKFKCPNYLQTHQEYLQYEYSKFRLGFEFIRVSHFNAFWSVLMHSDVFWPVLIDVLKSFGKMFDNMNSGQKFTQQTHQKYLLYEYLKWKYIVNLYGIMFCSTDSSRKEILCWQKFWIRECSCIMPYIKL